MATSLYFYGMNGSSGIHAREDRGAVAQFAVERIGKDVSLRRAMRASVHLNRNGNTLPANCGIVRSPGLPCPESDRSRAGLCEAADLLGMTTESWARSRRHRHQRRAERWDAVWDYPKSRFA